MQDARHVMGEEKKNNDYFPFFSFSPLASLVCGGANSK